VAIGYYCNTAHANCEVEFREAIAGTIPSLVKLADDWDEGVQWETAELVGNLANHGEWQLESIAVQLNRTTKWNFARPSQARFHCSLNGLRTRPFDGTL
jgi:hypothetical protein